jgi:chorismate dehydratase
VSARLGLVSYLNSKPIGFGLTAGRQRGRFEVIEMVPSALADELARGRLDLALIPSVEVARAAGSGRDAAIVPGIAIAARGAAESVLLFRRSPIEAVRSIALDVSSRTSAALLRLLLRRRLRPGLPDPRFVPAGPDLPAMLAEFEAALLIGDRALFAARELPGLAKDVEVHDLGLEWMALTGLPFVFAVWAVRPSVPPEPFLWSRDYGKRHVLEVVDAAVRRTGLPRELLATYLEGNLHHDLDETDEKGLAEFYLRAHRHGLIPSPDVPPFAGVPLVPRREV